jgi:hypothetical protein
MESEVYRRQVNTRDESLNRILVATACVKKSENQLIRTKHDLNTRVARCTEVDSGIFRIFTVKCNNYVIFVSQICLSTLT